MQDNNQGKGGFFVLPVVYIAPYPVPLHAWEQMQKHAADKNKMQTNMERQFKLPYPEDEE